MTSVTEFMKKNYADGIFHTHVSLIEPFGKFQFNRKDLDNFWKLYSNQLLSDNNFKYGIAEKAQPYLPILVDIDIKIEDSQTTPYIEHLYTDNDIKNIISIYQETLKEILDKYNDDDLTFCVLEKPIYYIKKENTNYIKSGIHLHAPKIFLSKIEQEVHLIPRVQAKMKQLKIFDNLPIENKDNIIDKQCCRVPWLLYGCSKSIDMDSYKLTYAIDSNGNRLNDLSDIFKNYSIYDMNEEKIKITGNEKYYLPQIFSIIPYGRQIYELKQDLIIPLSKNRNDFEQANLSKNRNDLEEEENNTLCDNNPIFTVISKLLELIPVSDFEGYSDWFKLVAIIHKVTNGHQRGLELITEYFGEIEENTRIYNRLNYTKNKYTIKSLYNIAKKYNQNIADDILENNNINNLIFAELNDKYGEIEFFGSNIAADKLILYIELIKTHDLTEQNQIYTAIYNIVNHNKPNYDNIKEKNEILKLASEIMPNAYLLKNHYGIIGYGYKTLNSLIKEKLTPDNQEYFKQKTKEIYIKHGISKLTEINEQKYKIIKFNERDDMKNKILYNPQKCIIISAGLGSGKTTATLDYINKINYKKIIVITPRISFADSILNRYNTNTHYNFKHYQNCIDNTPYLICQVESLNKIETEYYQDCLIILDEIESILCQLTSTETNGNNHLSNIMNFYQLLSISKKIICLDAFISEKTLNIFEKYDYVTYIYTQSLLNRKYKLIKPDIRPRKILKKGLPETCDVYGNDYFCKFINVIFNQLRQNKKLFIFISSLNKLKNFIDNIQNDPILKNKKYITYSSETPNDLSDVNTLWSKQDFIITTSSITVGINFDIPDYFDKIAIYVSKTSQNLIRDIFQNHYRIRHIKDNSIICAIDTSENQNTQKPILYDNIYKQVNNEIITIKNHYKDLGKELYDFNIHWIKHLFIFQKLEQNMSVVAIEPLFMKYLDLCNYEPEEEEEIPMTQEYTINQYNIIPYDDIPNLTNEQLNIIKNKKIKTKQEQAAITKFYYKMSFNDNFTEMWEEFNYFPHKIKLMAYEKSHINQLCDIADIAYDIDPILNDKLSIKIEILEYIRKYLSISNSTQVRTLIDRQLIIDSSEFFESIRDKINACCSTYDQSKKLKENEKPDVRRTIDLINRFLQDNTFIKLQAAERQRKRVNGKLIDTCPYWVIYNSDVKNVNLSLHKSHLRIHDYIKPKYIIKHDKVNVSNSILPPM